MFNYAAFAEINFPLAYNKDTRVQRQGRAIGNMFEAGLDGNDYKSFAKLFLPWSQGGNKEIYALWEVAHCRRVSSAYLKGCVFRTLEDFVFAAADGTKVTADVYKIKFDTHEEPFVRAHTSKVVFLDRTRYYDIESNSIISYWPTSVTTTTTTPQTVEEIEEEETIVPREMDPERDIALSPLDFLANVCADLDNLVKTHRYCDTVVEMEVLAEKPKHPKRSYATSVKTSNPRKTWRQLEIEKRRNTEPACLPVQEMMI